MANIVRKIAPVFHQFMRQSRYKAAFGGRGSGKSHFFAEVMIGNANNVAGFRAVCIREVQKSLKESAKRLLEDKIGEMGLRDRFECLSSEIKTPGGGVIIFQGMQDHTAESIKSLEGFNVAWVEEAQTLSARSLEMLRPTIRAPGSELWFSWNPRLASDPVDKFFRSGDPVDDAIVSKVNYVDNPWFPKELRAEMEFDRRTRPDRFGHVWLGEYEPQAVGAIWNMADIEERRVKEAPGDMTRIIVAVDPAVSSEEHSDEHGIVVAGLSETGHAYIFEDATTKGEPTKWARRAIAMFDMYEADAIIIEKNQGGDMCRHVLESVRPGLPIIEVHATRGKHVRAEPIAAMYSVGRVHHVGHFPQLEAQMCQVTSAGYEGEGSPDRVDALVWALTEIFPKLVNKVDTGSRRQQIAMSEYSEFGGDRHHGRQAVAMWE
jgi:phage terminase large subunit-like protein